MKVVRPDGSKARVRLRHRVQASFRGGVRRSGLFRSSAAAAATVAAANAGGGGGGDINDCILAIQIDEWSRTMFPLAFGLFNVGYWVYYTQLAQETK